MESQNLLSKHEKLVLPIASQGGQMETLYSWLKAEVAKTDYGAVGIEFHIHQSKITRVTKTVVLSGSTRVEK